MKPTLTASNQFFVTSLALVMLLLSPAITRALTIPPPAAFSVAGKWVADNNDRVELFTGTDGQSVSASNFTPSQAWNQANGIVATNGDISMTFSLNRQGVTQRQGKLHLDSGFPEIRWSDGMAWYRIFRIQAVASGRVLHEDGGNDLLISTRYQADDDYTRFVVEPVPGSEFFRLRVLATGRYLHVDGGGDRLLSTRYEADDDLTVFRKEAVAGGGDRIFVKATGRFLHADEQGDQIISTRVDEMDAFSVFQFVDGDAPVGPAAEYAQLPPPAPGSQPQMPDPDPGASNLAPSIPVLPPPATGNPQQIPSQQGPPPAGSGRTPGLQYEPLPRMPVPPAGAGIGAPAVAIAQTGSSFSPQEAQEFVDYHNAKRAEVGTPPVGWSQELAGVAQEWANHIAETGKFEHRPRSGPMARSSGENLWAGGGGGFTRISAAESWYSEINQYPAGTPVTQQNFMAVGHYTQMVWHSTTEIGAGVAVIKTGNMAGMTVIVCNYNPPGNYIGQKPY